MYAGSQTYIEIASNTTCDVKVKEIRRILSIKTLKIDR